MSVHCQALGTAQSALVAAVTRKTRPVVDPMPGLQSTATMAVPLAKRRKRQGLEMLTGAPPLPGVSCVHVAPSSAEKSRPTACAPTTTWLARAGSTPPPGTAGGTSDTSAMPLQEPGFAQGAALKAATGAKLSPPSSER